MKSTLLIKAQISLLCFFCTFQLSAQKNYSGKESITQPKIFAEGIISTGEYETHPAFSPSGDTVYFLKCLADANFCTICVSYYKKGKWSAPQVVSFSGKYTDADPFVTKDGKTIYFVSNRPVHEGDSAKEDWDIWKTELTSSGWAKPVHLDSPFNSSSSEFFPTIADNGNLYFGSSREGGKGRADIYFSKSINNKYTEPQNLGDSINTAGNEYEPFIAPNESYLIFMATYPNGVAHADFYISYNLKGKWSKAKKLPSPINSPVTEWGGKVSRDGKYFFFGSSRNKINEVLPQREDMQQFEKRLNNAGNGLGDIYNIDFSSIKKLLSMQQTTTFTEINEPTKTDKEQLSDLNAQFIKNFISQDTVAHNRIIHKDFVCIEGSGEIVNREKYMKDWAHDYENGSFTSFKYFDEFIRLFGDMALVRSKTKYTRVTDGKTVEGYGVYTDTYIKENGRWWCIQAHITPVR